MTCTKACTVSAIFNSGETSMLILEAEKKGQYGFAAPTDAVEVSDEEALITQVFKTAVPGLPGQNGIRQGENAELKNLTAESGTFAGAVNANGGINIPLAVGAATDTSAVNRLYAAGLAAVTDAFSVRCYPLLADCSSSNGTVFKTDKEPNSLYFNVPPNSAFTVKCGLVTNARPMHNYSSIRLILPGIMKTMEERGKKIEESLDEAEKTKQEAIAKRAESDSIVTDARRQAADIVLEARKDAESERARIIEAAHKEAEEIIAKAHTTVEDERKSIYAGAASSIADLSVAVATKIVGEALEDDAEQKKLIERYIQEAGSHNAD